MSLTGLARHNKSHLAPSSCFIPATPLATWLSVDNRNTANSLHSGIFGRSGLSTNSVSSLVRLALSSNFPSGLLNQV